MRRWEQWKRCKQRKQWKRCLLLGLSLILLTGFRDAAQRASDLASRLGIQDTSETDNE